jgi:hypothetical protein
MNEIINKYLYLVHRLERGYREDLTEIVDLIFLEKYKDKLPYYESRLYCNTEL